MTEAVILGVAETPYTRDSELADQELCADAIALALQDAGLGKADVDGLAVTTMTVPDDSAFLADHLGFELSWVLKADYGGGGGLGSIARARHAIAAGAVDVVVAVAGGNRQPHLQHDIALPPGDYSRRSWVAPFGYGGPNSLFGLVQRRHMYEHGTTLEQLGKIATTFRRHAQLNDNALLTDDMSIQDYIDSRLISDPIRLFDCVMPACGAAAVVVASTDVARRTGRQPVHLGPYGENVNHQVAKQSADRLEMGFVEVAKKLFGDVERDDMDFLQLYDDYPIAVTITLEDLGFAEKGRGGKFLDEVDISVWGDLPINTGGGQLSIGQPSLAGGYLHIVEAVRQIRGECGERQVPDARTGLVTGIGLLPYQGNIAVANGLVVAREAL